MERQRRENEEQVAEMSGCSWGYMWSIELYTAKQGQELLENQQTDSMWRKNLYILTPVLQSAF